MINIQDLKSELLWFLRNNNFLTIAQRGVETETIEDTLDEDVSYEIEDTKVKNIRSLKVNDEVLRLGYDYDLNTEENAVVSFKTPKTGTLEITYDTGIGDKIWSDYPRDNLSISQYPRIGFDVVAINTTPLSLGAKDYINEILISIVIYAEKNREVESILNNIRTKLIQNAKNFYFNRFIQVTNIGRLIEDNEYNSIVHRSIDLISKWKVEDIEDES
jgi:hypothetical protein